MYRFVELYICDAQTVSFLCEDVQLRNTLSLNISPQTPADISTADLWWKEEQQITKTRQHINQVLNFQSCGIAWHPPVFIYCIVDHSKYSITLLHCAVIMQLTTDAALCLVSFQTETAEDRMKVFLTGSSACVGMMEGDQSREQHDALTWFTKFQLQSVLRSGVVPEWFHGIISRK